LDGGGRSANGARLARHAKPLAVCFPNLLSCVGLPPLVARLRAGTRTGAQSCHNSFSRPAGTLDRLAAFLACGAAFGQGSVSSPISFFLLVFFLKGTRHLLVVALSCAAGLCAPAYAQSITPEDLRKLLARSEPLILVDAARLPVDWAAPRGSNTKIILFDANLAGRAARAIAERHHHSGQFDVLWLSGTVPEWVEQRLPVVGAALPPESPLPISAADLDAIVRQGVPVTLLDIRAPERFKRAHVPGSKWSMPHDAENVTKSFPANQWLIIIDAGEGTSRLIAEQLKQRGRDWVAYVAGGFPAWAAVAQR
jgi:rhodanese-related sulfurtransferase